MVVAVLGGSGFIGSRVVRTLATEGRAVVSLDLVQSTAVFDTVRFAKTNILDGPSVERVFTENGVDTVLDMVGLPVIDQCEKDPQLSFLLNVLSLQNTLEAMRKADIKDIIFASSAAVYGYTLQRPVMESEQLVPRTVYGFHKLVGEKLIEAYSKSYGLRFTTLRFFNVYGADPSVGKDVISVFIRKAQKGETLDVKGAKKFRDFIHADDVAQVVARLCSMPKTNSAINVGTGVAVTLEDITDLVAEFCPGLRVNLETDADDGTGLIADTTTLYSLTGFVPRNPMTGIRSYIGLQSVDGGLRNG